MSEFKNDYFFLKMPNFYIIRNYLYSGMKELLKVV